MIKNLDDIIKIIDDDPYLGSVLNTARVHRDQVWTGRNRGEPSLIFFKKTDVPTFFVMVEIAQNSRTKELVLDVSADE